MAKNSRKSTTSRSKSRSGNSDVTSALKSLKEKQRAAAQALPKRKNGGSRESEAISKLFKEKNDVNLEDETDRISKKFCLNFLAFVDDVSVVHNNYLDVNKKGTPVKLQLDERVPIMISVGITRILCNIIRSTTPKTVIDPQSGADITMYSSKAILDKAFSVLKSSTDSTVKQLGVTTQRSLKGNYDDLRITGQKYGLAISQQVSDLFKTDPEKTAGNFQSSINGGGIVSLLRTSIKGYLQGELNATNSKFSTEYKTAMEDVLVLIAAIVIAFTLLRYYDTFFTHADKSQKPVSAYTGANQVVLHRTMTWPTLTAVLEVFGVSTSRFDEDMAYQIEHIKEVQNVFKEATKAYDQSTSKLSAVNSTYSKAKNQLFVTEAEKREAEKLYDSLAVTRKGPPTAFPPRNMYRSQVADEIAKRNLGLSFGRRRKSRKSRKSRKGRKSSFGRKRKSSRRHRKRRVSKFGNDDDESESDDLAMFGRRRRKSGKKARKSRKSRKSSFGRKRKGSRKSRKHHKRRSHFGDPLLDQINSGAQFGRRRKSSKKARKSHKKRSSFGKRRRRSHKKAGSFVFVLKKKGRKSRKSRKSSFGRKRKGSRKSRKSRKSHRKH